MSKIYYQYKPFRNFIRKLDIVDSLCWLWLFNQNLLKNKSLPKGYFPTSHFGTKTELSENLYHWDIATLIEEVLKHAGNEKKESLKDWRTLRRLINSIRELENLCSEVYLEKEDVLLEVNRLLHRQTPWQRTLSRATALRYAKIYGTEEIAESLKTKIGLEWIKIYQIFLSLYSLFQDKPMLRLNPDLSSLGIGRDEVDIFLKFTSTDLKNLKRKLHQNGEIDENWIYRFSPLVQTPIIIMNINGEDKMICPLPHLLWERISQGLYFDLIDNALFPLAHGAAFERYIGEVLINALEVNIDQYKIIKPNPYYDRKNLKHGADWIIFDKTANLFIEAKTKKLRFNAKFLLDAEQLGEDIDTISVSIVQNYKNIIDAQNKKTDWEPNNLPTYSIIVTMEDWQVFSPLLQDRIQKSVEHKLDLAGIGRNVLLDTPYILCSCEEFEIFCRVLGSYAIHEILSVTTSPQYKNWLFRTYLFERYSETISNYSNKWFERDWENITNILLSRAAPKP